MGVAAAPRSSLAVIGAGPKGLAIAAKRAALLEAGWQVPDLVVIDRSEVAANWSGASGYTDGRQPLSAPPEKDVGYPYALSWGPASRHVSDGARRWSWQSYLIHQGGLADWVDRGQPRPNHGQWYRYLRWVAEQLAVEPIHSDPLAAGWPQLAERHRREFLKRTDRGVFSVQIQRLLDQAAVVRTLAGRVTHLEPAEAKVIVEVDYEQRRERLAFDWVIVAVGFDPLWFAPLLGPSAQDALTKAVGGPPGRLPARTAVERAIGYDLAVTELRPRLHLPTLAGLAQGPGFPNLSCLSLLADRVLGVYAEAGRTDPRRPVDRGAFHPGHDEE